MRFRLFNLNRFSRACAAFAILFTCDCASAGMWTVYWRGTDADLYFDPISVRQRGTSVEVDVLVDFNGVIERRNGTKYMSMSGIERYNCEDDTYAYVSLVVWEAPLGTGKLLSESKSDETEIMKVAPETAAGKLFNILCGKPAKRQ